MAGKRSYQQSLLNRPRSLSGMLGLRLQHRGQTVCSMLLMRDPETRRMCRNPREHGFHTDPSVDQPLSSLKQLDPAGRCAHFNALYNILEAGGKRDRVSCEKARRVTEPGGYSTGNPGQRPLCEPCRLADVEPEHMCTRGRQRKGRIGSSHCRRPLEDEGQRGLWDRMGQLEPVPSHQGAPRRAEHAA